MVTGVTKMRSDTLIVNHSAPFGSVLLYNVPLREGWRLEMHINSKRFCGTKSNNVITNTIGSAARVSGHAGRDFDICGCQFVHVSHDDDDDERCRMAGKKQYVLFVVV